MNEGWTQNNLKWINEKGMTESTYQQQLDSTSSSQTMRKIPLNWVNTCKISVIEALFYIYTSKHLATPRCLKLYKILMWQQKYKLTGSLLK